MQHCYKSPDLQNELDRSLEANKEFGTMQQKQTYKFSEKKLLHRQLTSPKSKFGMGAPREEFSSLLQVWQRKRKIVVPKW
jgi:hypothetical protein